MSDTVASKNKVRERIQNAVGCLDEKIHDMDISEDAKQNILDNFNWLLTKSREYPEGETVDFLNDQICGLLDLVDSISSGEEEADTPEAESDSSLLGNNRTSPARTQEQSTSRIVAKDEVAETPATRELPAPPISDRQEDLGCQRGLDAEAAKPENDRREQRMTSRGQDWMENGKDTGAAKPENDQREQRMTSRGKDWMENGKDTELAPVRKEEQEEPRRLNARDWMRSASYPWQDPNRPDPNDVHSQPVRKITPSFYDGSERRRHANQPHHNYGRDQLLRLMPDDKPDVVLNIPNVSVDLIDFEINNLSARVAVDATVAQDAVKLFVGVDVHLERVKLTIENVQACAQLIVRLDTVRQIVDRALEAIDSDKHPSVLGMTQGLLKR